MAWGVIRKKDNWENSLKEKRKIIMAGVSPQNNCFLRVKRNREQVANNGLDLKEIPNVRPMVC